jgi:hypothetical protein
MSIPASYASAPSTVPSAPYALLPEDGKIDAPDYGASMLLWAQSSARTAAPLVDFTAATTVVQAVPEYSAGTGLDSQQMEEIRIEMLRITGMMCFVNLILVIASVIFNRELGVYMALNIVSLVGVTVVFIVYVIPPVPSRVWCLEACFMFYAIFATLTPVAGLGFAIWVPFRVDNACKDVCS